MKRRKRPDPAEAWFNAAKAGDRDRLEALLAGGADVNARDRQGRTALFHVLAPYGGDPNLAMWLLSCGADVNARDHAGDSAIEYASDHTSSGTEANMLAHVREAFERRGYRRRK